MPGMNGTRLKRRIAECSVAGQSAPGARTLVRSTPRTSTPPYVPSASQPPASSCLPCAGNNMPVMNGTQLKRVVADWVLCRSGAQANATASWSACGKRSATPLFAGRTERQGPITLMPGMNGTPFSPSISSFPLPPHRALNRRITFANTALSPRTSPEGAADHSPGSAEPRRGDPGLSQANQEANRALLTHPAFTSSVCKKPRRTPAAQHPLHSR